MKASTKHKKSIAYTGKKLPETTEVFDTYWRFAALRQDLFFKRANGERLPWTNDAILSTYKFTNTYRAADRVSQYLIRDVIYNPELPDSPREIFFRILLFKLFNKIETWELLRFNLGKLTFEDYKFEDYNHILSETIEKGERIYSAAYIMASLKTFYGFDRKHSNHLKLIEWALSERMDQKLSQTSSLSKAFELLKSFPGFGDFLAYQITIDMNYSPIINFSESEFVVAGPGAKGGISKCFVDTKGWSEESLIKYMTDTQDDHFDRLGLEFKNLWGRRLQLIDCQNIFCEVDKYSRVKHPDIKGDSNRTRIKQLFKANVKPIQYFFPPKWGINKNINQL